VANAGRNSVRQGACSPTWNAHNSGASIILNHQEKTVSTANVTETVAASAADVWRIISDFAGVETNEMIASCTVVGEGVGAVRTIGLVGGGDVIERLESHDDSALVFSYAIINESPLPVKNYLSTVKVADAEAGSATINWSSTFEAAGAPEADVVKMIEGIYKGGIARTRSKLGL